MLKIFLLVLFLFFIEGCKQTASSGTTLPPAEAVAIDPNVGDEPQVTNTLKFVGDDAPTTIFSASETNQTN